LKQWSEKPSRSLGQRVELWLEFDDEVVAHEMTRFFTGNTNQQAALAEAKLFNLDFRPVRGKARFENALPDRGVAAKTEQSPDQSKHNASGRKPLMGQSFLRPDMESSGIELSGVSQGIIEYMIHVAHQQVKALE